MTNVIQKLLNYEIQLFSFRMLVIIMFAIISCSQAYAFPFRGLSIGEKMIDARFIEYGSGKTISVSSHKDNPLIIAMWGGDLKAKKNRAIKSLIELNKLQPYLDKNNVKTIVVNMQNDAPELIDEVTSKSGVTLPFYKDGQEVYGKMGVYVLPSFLFISAQGVVSGGIGFSSDFRQRLKGEIDIMLGYLTREEHEKNLNPEISVADKKHKNAIRHMNMGLSMKRKGMVDTAIRELLNALELDPELNSARIELGCLYLQKDDLDKAVSELETGLDRVDESIPAEICLANVKAKKGEVAEAISDLESLLFKNNLDPDLHYTLGTLYEIQGDMEKSSSEYRKAFELLQRQF